MSLLLLFNPPASGAFGTATQSLSIGQSAPGTVAVQGSAAQSLSVGQTAPGTVLIQGVAAQSLSIGQVASGTNSSVVATPDERTVHVLAEDRTALAA